MNHSQLVDCAFDQKAEYAHAFYSNGRFIRYEMANKIKRVSKPSYRNNYDFILPDKGNVIGIKGKSIYEVVWSFSFSGGLWTKLSTPFKRPRMRSYKFDYDFSGNGKVTQVQYDSSSEILIGLCGQTINIMNVDDESKITVNIPSQSVIRIFLDPDGKKIICHYDKNIVIYDISTGSEILRVENMSNLFVGVGDRSGDYTLTRRVKKDMEYVIGVDT